METTTAPTNAAASASPGFAQSLRHMIDETDRFLRTAAQSGDEKFDAMRDRFVEQARQMRQQLDALEETAVYKARRAARETDRTVHAHPYAAIGIAAAAALLIGFLAARR